MKFPLIISLAASLAACSTTGVQSTQSQYDKSARYATNTFEPGAPDFATDIPAEGPAPANLEANPAYIPSPLLRQSAASSP